MDDVRGWLIQWALRIGVWVFLGPWMKLADMYHTQRNETTDKARQEAEARVKAKYQALLASTDAIRTREEDLTKLKDMENYLFGKYLAVLPRFKQQRHLDVPLSSSYTLPHESGSEQCDISRRVYGQHLTGEMIPKRFVTNVVCCSRTVFLQAISHFFHLNSQRDQPAAQERLKFASMGENRHSSLRSTILMARSVVDLAYGFSLTAAIFLRFVPRFLCQQCTLIALPVLVRKGSSTIFTLPRVLCSRYRQPSLVLHPRL